MPPAETTPRERELAALVLVLTATLNEIRDVVDAHAARRGWSTDVETIAAIIGRHDAAILDVGMAGMGE